LSGTLLFLAMSKRQISILASALLVTGIGPRQLFAAAATQPSSMPTGSRVAIDPSAGRPVFLFDDDDDDNPKPAGLPTSNPTSGRYFFGLLDNRSSYGKDFFPDPFIGPEFDSEQQVELDYLHGAKAGAREDEVDAGIQWNVVGQLTLAGEFGRDSQHEPGIGNGPEGDLAEREDGTGFENADLAAYHPIFQYVSADGQFDYTAVVRFDVGIPTRTRVSGKDVQLTPYLGQLLRVGDHVSIEAWTGSQFTIAPRQTDQFVYGASVGYRISHEQLPLPLTEQVTPLFELDGQTPWSGNGQDALFGVTGLNIQFKSLGKMQPGVELGYQFPIDQGAREQLHWGVVTEFLLEF